MGVYSSFEKKAGMFTVTVSEPSPRRVVVDTGSSLGGLRMTIEDARDLMYALDRVIMLANADDLRNSEKR